MEGVDVIVEVQVVWSSTSLYLYQEEVDLCVGVQVETSLAVQKVRDKCSMLPSMDKKLDTILGLAQANADKLDQVRPHTPKPTHAHTRTHARTRARTRTQDKADKLDRVQFSCLL
jgi:hypothetical protein